MEGIKKKRRHSIIESNEVINDFVKYPYINGWNNIEELASYIWSSIHSKLLEGNLIFAYKNIPNSKNKEFFQIVIVRDIDNTKLSFSIGMITPGYTMLLPKVPFSYLEEGVISDLEKYNIDKDIINIYNKIIGGIKNEITCN